MTPVFAKTLRLTSQEQHAITEFVSSAREALKDNLVEVWLFGSAARGDRWAAHQNMRSDIDILIVTRTDLDREALDHLDNTTYPLFLECGSQISTQVRTRDWIVNPPDEPAQAFVERLKSDALGLYPSGIAESKFQHSNRP